MSGGALMAVLATYAYRRTFTSIERGEFGSALGLSVVLGLIPVILALMALALILVRW